METRSWLTRLRGLPSNRKLSADTEREAVAILSQPVYRGFGPTLAAEYLAKKHKIEVSRETVRQWMIGAKLWRPRKQRIEKVHEWRPRRSRFGELVQWDTSDHDWLEGRGEEILLINMIDDATSRWFARFVSSDSTVENMNHLERYLKKHGRPLAYYTDKAAIFQTAEKTKRDGSRLGKSREELPPTQIGRALQELGIPWIAAHSPQAKGRVERGFLTAQDRLVKGLRVAGVTTLEGANHYLETEFLPWVNATIAVVPANADDAHRPLEKQHDLAAILSHVEKRRVNADYTFPLDAKTYRILRQDICAGLRGSLHTRGATAGWFGGGPLQRAVSPGGEMRAAAQGSASQTSPEESASPAGAEKHMGPELRFEERAEGLAGSASIRSQTRRNRNDRSRDCGSGAKAKFALYRETLRTTGW